MYFSVSGEVYMDVKRISADTKSRRSALPCFLPGGSTAILALHGYNGYPRDLLYLGEALNKQGFTVAIPRLPGHGTNAADFHETGGGDWLRHAADCYFDLKARFNKVHLLGFSMGGLIALILASQFPVERMALIAPAVMHKDWAVKLTPLLQHFIKKMRRRWVDETADPDRLFLAQEYWSWHYIDMTAQFVKLQKLARKRLAFVSCDTLIFVSEEDEQVPVRAADYICGRISSLVKKTVLLKHSPHCSTDGPEKELIAGRLAAWFDEKDPVGL